MDKIKSQIKGFTMVELMIVAIIVAILAVVLTPLMAGHKARAYSTEAETALGNLRESLRLYYVENSVYPDISNPTQIDTFSWIKADDLRGTFFSAPNYTLTSSASAGTYTVLCNWTTADNDAPRRNEVSRYPFTTSIDERGTILRNGY
jgi:prepilin-type N-terminal cleavage/methylation domain-containing protein